MGVPWTAQSDHYLMEKAVMKNEEKVVREKEKERGREQEKKKKRRTRG